jgi:hypothetical protein
VRGEDDTPSDPLPIPPPAPGQLNERGFLWKPVGENSRKLAVLLPECYRLAREPRTGASNERIVDKVFIRGGLRNGDKPQSLYRGSKHEKRLITRWSRPGADYGKAFDVLVIFKGGTASWEIKDGAKRQT